MWAYVWVIVSLQRGVGGFTLPPPETTQQLSNTHQSEGGKSGQRPRVVLDAPSPGRLFQCFPLACSLKPFARELPMRMTDAKQALCSKVRRKQLNGRVFFSQKAIGSYTVDFTCPSVKLVVELDGRAKDEIRVKALANLGLSALRLSCGV
ncbi:MAG: DUF559 domain-containing protein [Syntrophobacteraceae bacterium]|nr:DUF559 domain-containing protein [Syntrophobacteraceae bacterium]